MSNLNLSLMKKILLIVSLLSSFFSIANAQSLYTSSTNVASGGTITVTGVAESSFNRITNVSFSNSIDIGTVSGGSGGAVTAVLSDIVLFNAATSVATSFKLKFSTTHTTDVNVLVSVTLTIYNSQTNKTTTVPTNIGTITVKPATVTTYYNTARSQVFNKNNCGSGYVGSAVTYSVPANKYSSTTSQADANNKAQNEINANGQTYANTNGSCNIDLSNWIIWVVYERDTDLLQAQVLWRPEVVNTPTLKFEIWQYGVYIATVATGVPNTGSAALNVVQYLHNTGFFADVQVRIISEADPSIFFLTPPTDWWYR